MHLTQEHTPMPNASAGPGPTSERRKEPPPCQGRGLPGPRQETGTAGGSERKALRILFTVTASWGFHRDNSDPRSHHVHRASYGAGTRRSNYF